MSKKDELKQPDVVQDKLQKALIGASDNRGPLLMGLGVLMLAVIGYLAWDYTQESALAEKNHRLAQATLRIEEARESSDTEKAQKLSEAKAVLETLYADTSGTSLHIFVLLKLADMYTVEKNYKGAIGALNELLKESSVPADVASAAYYQLMKIYIADYNVVEAMATGRRGLEAEEGPYTSMIKAELDRLARGSLNAKLTEELKAREMTGAQPAAPVDAQAQ